MPKSLLFGLLWAVGSTTVHAAFQVEVGQNNASWTFPTLPGPRAGDLGESGTFTVVEGALNGNSAPVTVLNDGHKQDGPIDCCNLTAPNNPDGINDSAWIAENTSGKVMLSFSEVKEIGAVRTYSWFELAGQNNARAAQKYRLYGSAAASPATTDAALAGPDWTLLATVDTDAVTGGGASRPAQIGVAVSASGGRPLLGNFRHLLWAIGPVDGIGTFFGEFDVEPPITYGDLVRADNPIHYYRFEDSDPLLPVEDSGTPGGNPGTLSGGATLGESSSPLLLGNALRVDGSGGSFVDLGLFHPGNSVTLEAWVNADADASSTFKAVIARWDGSYEMDWNGQDVANLVIRNDADAFGIVDGRTPLVRGQWHHMVGIFDAGTLTLYVDGVQGTTQTIGGVLQNAGRNPIDRVLIGATRTGNFNWKGLIDEVAVYNYALTSARIQAHFRAAFAPTPPVLNVEKAVLLTWPTTPPGYVLQGAPTLDGLYENVTNAVTVENSMFKLCLPSGQPQKFFRLFNP